MKKIRLLSICGILFFASFQLMSQVTLPYYSGFDNATQQEGWLEYKTASTEFSHWGYGSSNAYSSPNDVGHDYSPSTGITLTDNWFVSPGFSLSGGGQLDSIRYKFSGFSTPVEGDTIAVYLLNGSQDPSVATSKILLFDFRDEAYLTDNTYRILPEVDLPQSEGLSYLAIRYRNTDCSSKWLTVHFDNIAISGGTTGLNEISKNQNEIYPNPSTGYFMVNSLKEIESISIQNEKGQLVYQSSNSIGSNRVEIDLSNKPKGIYILRIQQGKELTTQKLILQ